MSAVLRHLAVRLWATALLGSVLCMMVLPFWQSVLKVQWVAIPVIVMLSLCFVLLGWGMNRHGSARIRRLLDEAGAWERAGDRETAHEALEGVVAVFDSFWLSPLGRHKIESMITGRLARFYLSQPSSRPRAQLMVHQYLMRHPDDIAVVRSWLAQIVADPNTHARYDMLAAKISEALPDDPDVQQLLMDYYLGAQRSDFDAIQTYHRVWQLNAALPDTVVRALARVLLQNKRLNDWTLEVYLKGYDTGDPYCLEGVAAACRYLRPHPGNRHILTQARSLCESLEADFMSKALGRFKPLAVAAQPISPAPLKSKAARRPLSATLGLTSVPRLVTAAAQMRQGVSGLISGAAKAIRHAKRRPWPRHPFKPVLLKPVMGVVLLVLAVGVTLLVGYRYQHHQKPNPDIPAVAEAPPPRVDLPFTIQVAAYLKPDDAQRYVAQLISQGLEAFSTQAVSARRKWYQVKVSRFETKPQAQLYGEKLKSQGLIDDFYVANYQQPPATP